MFADDYKTLVGQPKRQQGQLKTFWKIMRRSLVN